METPASRSSSELNSKDLSVLNSMAEKISESSTPATSLTNLQITGNGYSTPVRRRHQVAVLIVGWVTQFQVAGFTQAYGVFQRFHSDQVGNPLQALLPDHHATQRGVLALVGQLSSTSSAYLLGPILASFLDNAKPRRLKGIPYSDVTCMMVLGAVLLGTGYGLAAFSTKLWQLVLTQGIMAGLGGALLWYPAQVMGPEYFQSKRATAFGVISSGSSLGALFYAPITHVLFERVGIRKTMGTYAVVNLLLGLVLAAIMPAPRPTATGRKFFPRRLLHDSTLYVLIFGSLAFQTCLGLPGIFGPDFARTLGMNAQRAAIWLAIFNGVGFVPRLALGFIGDKCSRQITSLVSTILALIAVFAFWMPAAQARSLVCLWLFTIVFGMMASAYSQFITPVALDIYGPEVYNSVVGAISLARGVGSIIGGPIGGAVLHMRQDSRKEQSDDYTMLIVFTGVCLFATLVSQSWVWFSRRPKKADQMQSSSV